MLAEPLDDRCIPFVMYRSMWRHHLAQMDDGYPNPNDVEYWNSSPLEYRDRILRALCSMWKHWAPHEEEYQRSLGNGPPVHDGPMKVVDGFSETSKTEDALLQAVRQAWIVARSTEEEEESTKKDYLSIYGVYQ